MRSDFIEIERCCEKRDYEASAEICRKERNVNDPVALTWLGGLHECGVIHGASLSAAMECFRAAAERGYPLAIHSMGELLRQGGPGLPADPEAGNRLIQSAYEMGFVEFQPVGPGWFEWDVMDDD